MSRNVTNIAMLSTHGYFDPIPQLGRTDTGGQVVYVLQLVRALTTHNMKVDIYTRWFDQSKKQVEELPNCPDARVIRIKAGPWEFIPKEKIYRVLPELTENMLKFISDNKLHYNLFHGHYVDAGIVTLDVAEALSKPAFFTAHSLGAWKKERMKGDPRELEGKYNFKRRLAEEMKIFRSVRAQTVTTELQKEKLKELYGFESDNVVVIPPGVDVHRFSPPEDREDRIRDNRYIFCLSRIDANKGHNLLLYAFDIVRKSVKDVRLVIGGGSPNPGPREREVLDNMKRIIKEREMQDSVEIMGYISDDMLVSLYGRAELFVLPSIFEPFGMTALEAMACGTPVVASKFGGIKNVIESGVNGLLVDPADADEFARAIIGLLDNSELARLYGRRGRETILEHFSWESIAERHLAFYDRFMK